MRFQVLGPVEVRDGQRRLAIGGPQQRALLAALLLNGGQVVSTERLIEYLWADRPPSKARGLLQGCVAGLRRALSTANASARLETRAPGYLMDVRPGELDLAGFEELSQTAGASSDPEQRAALLGEALALWNGPALANLPREACRPEIAHLEERRLTVFEARIDADLLRGCHAELVGELTGFVREHPLRERFWAQLMLALHGADRQAEALATYARVRRLLVEELGVEPGSTIRELQQDILAGDDALGRYAGRNGLRRRESGDGGTATSVQEKEQSSGEPTPSQLPASPVAFTGRAAQLGCLESVLSDSSAAARIAVLSGMAGVGKTALAVHWAYQVREGFPDGQLYANLHGYSSEEPARPIAVLTGFLRALGVKPDEMPDTAESAAALYRTMLTGKRVLVVLDNASNPQQVRPLLPGDPGCFVVVTSRDRQGGLLAREGARSIELDVLDPAEAEMLMHRLLGAERVRAEPDAAIDLAKACAWLPLALRIGAANLALQPELRIADLAAELGMRDRLDGLGIEGDEHTAVRAAFDLSYKNLTSGAARLFRLLGLQPGADTTAEAAGVLAGLPTGEARKLLGCLVDAHLIERNGPGRYAFHDLLKLYAAERASIDEPPAERQLAMERLIAGYLTTTDAAARKLYPERVRLPVPEQELAVFMASFDEPSEALAWLDAERSNLLALTLHIARHGPREVAWLLGNALQGYFHFRMYTVDWRTLTEAGLRAAEDAADLAGQSACQMSLGDRTERLGDYVEATKTYQRALDLAQAAGWLEGQAASLGVLGILARRGGRGEEARRYYLRALELDRKIGWLPGLSSRLTNLGNYHAERAELEEAAEYYEQALEIARKIGSRSGEAILVGNLGEACRFLQRHQEALSYIEQAIRLNREVGHRGLEADNRRLLAEVHRDMGNYEKALELAESALASTREIGDPRYLTNALHALGTIRLRLGDPEGAWSLHQQALGLARQSGSRQHETEVLIGLAEVHLNQGRFEAARTDAAKAHALATRFGLQLLEGPALDVLAAIENAR